MNTRGATWTLSFSPYARMCEVPAEAALQCALYVMYRWGYIRCFRFDNGLPFGDPRRQSVTPCALNLVARGCDVLFNSPRTPTQNAKVERCQGTTARWSDARQSANIEQFRANLDYAVIAQRERLPSRVCQGLTRAAYYPGLFSNPRRYDPTDFDLARVYQYLAEGQWYRKVSSHGQASMFSQVYQVGFAHRHCKVQVNLQIENQLPYWCFFDEKQNLIYRALAENLVDGSYLNVSSLSKN